MIDNIFILDIEFKLNNSNEYQKLLTDVVILDKLGLLETILIQHPNHNKRIGLFLFDVMGYE